MSHYAKGTLQTNISNKVIFFPKVVIVTACATVLNLLLCMTLKISPRTYFYRKVNILTIQIFYRHFIKLNEEGLSDFKNHSYIFFLQNSYFINKSIYSTDLYTNPHSWQAMGKIVEKTGISSVSRATSKEEEKIQNSKRFAQEICGTLLHNSCGWPHTSFHLYIQIMCVGSPMVCIFNWTLENL